MPSESSKKLKCETCGTMCSVNPKTKRVWCSVCVARGKSNEFFLARFSTKHTETPEKKEK